MKASGDVEDLLDRVRKAFAPGSDQRVETGRRQNVAKNITVKGDAMIATEVKIDNLQTRVTNETQDESISPLQAAQLGARANDLVNDNQSLDDILTWLAAKFGVPGYLSIPASGYAAAMAYLEERAAAKIHDEIDKRGTG